MYTDVNKCIRRYWIIKSHTINTCCCVHIWYRVRYSFSVETISFERQNDSNGSTGGREKPRNVYLPKRVIVRNTVLSLVDRGFF